MSRAVAKERSWVRRLMDDLTLRLSAVFILAVILMPAEGLGVDLCPSRVLTNAPCPGCGMTRSGANLVRGHFLRAVQYHPFGPVLIPIIAVLGFLGLAPQRGGGGRGRLWCAISGFSSRLAPPAWPRSSSSERCAGSVLSWVGPASRHRGREAISAGWFPLLG